MSSRGIKIGKRLFDHEIQTREPRCDRAAIAIGIAEKAARGSPLSSTDRAFLLSDGWCILLVINFCGYRIRHAPPLSIDRPSPSAGLAAAELHSDSDSGSYRGFAVCLRLRFNHRRIFHGHARGKKERNAAHRLLQCLAPQHALKRKFLRLQN